MSEQGLDLDLSQTQAALVVGRRIPVRTLRAADIRSLLTAAKSAGLSGVPSGDIGEVSEAHHRTIEDVVIGWCIGRALAEADGPIGPWSLEDLRDGVAAAQARVDRRWSAVDMAMGAGPWRFSQTSLWLISTGPLGSGWLSYGVQATEAQADTWGVDFAQGASRHGPHPLGVAGFGVQVSAEGTPTMRIDLSDVGHGIRADTVDGLQPAGGYYLIGQYD
ncbi:MAG: hypothetical protein AAFV53_26395 [Myxococcota bacterium]